MGKDCWAALRAPFEVTGPEFQVRPVSGIVCFSPSIVHSLGGDAEGVEDWVEVWPGVCTEGRESGDESSHAPWNQSE